MEIEPLLDLLITKGREELLKTLPANSCLSSSKFAIEILKLAKQDAFEVPCHLVTYNNGLVIVGRNPKIESSENRWGGHMIVTIGSWFLDMSLDQIGLQPAYWWDDLSNDDDWPKQFLQNNKSLIYFKDVQPGWYRAEPAWKELWKPAYDVIAPLIVP